MVATGVAKMKRSCLGGVSRAAPAAELMSYPVSQQRLCKPAGTMIAMD